jgi:outer membrane protein TolC
MMRGAAHVERVAAAVIGASAVVAVPGLASALAAGGAVSIEQPAGEGGNAYLFENAARWSGVRQDSMQLTLEETVRRTIASHPAAGESVAQVDRTEAGVRELRATRIPRLSVEGGGTRFQEPMLVAPLHGFDPQSPPQFDRLLVQGRAPAALTLFDGGARGARITSGRAGVMVAEAGVAGTTASLIEGAVRAYVEVRAGREIVAANEARVAALEEERDRAGRMVAAGSEPRVAALRAEAALARAVADRAAAVADLRRAEADLARLIGADTESVRRVSLESVMVPASVAVPDREALIALAMRSNSAVERARAQVAVAEAGVAESRAAFWPVLALNGGYNVFGSGAGDWIGEWQAAVQVVFPVFTGGARAAAVDRSRAVADGAAAALAHARLAAASDIDAALARLAGARAQVGALSTAVEQFVAVAEIEALSLLAGAGVQPDYLSAVSDVLDARAALTRARSAEVGARVALSRIAGELDAAWLNGNLEVGR